MILSEWIYINNDDNSCRFALGTKGENPLVCFGINPSTAIPQKLDTTISKVKTFASKNDFDSWIMLNIYPQRTTDPNGLDNVINKAILQENLKHIDNILSAISQTQIWAAWGEPISTRPYLLNCLKEIHTIATKYSCRWIQFGDSTKTGHPRHPSRLSYSCSKRDFDVDLYLK